MKKRILALVMASMMGLSIGCSNNTIDKEGDSNTGDIIESVENETDDGSKVIVDDLGYEVQLPEEINRVVIADLPGLVHAYYVANGSTEGLVGAPKDNALVDNMLAKVYPEVANLSTGFRRDGNINMEELLSLEPDVIFYRSDMEETGKLIRESGVAAVAFQTYNKDNGNTVTVISSWLKMLGEILGKEERAEEIIDNAYKAIGFVQSRMWDIKEEEKVSMMYFNGLTQDQVKVSGEGLFGTFWAEISEANDLSLGEIKGAKVISMEQLYNYNPEVMFTVFSSLKPEDIYNDPNYAKIDAVKNNKVYAAPAGVFSWYGPSTDVPLSFLWHAKMLYPETFSDVDLVSITKDYYKKYYNYTITEEDIEFLFGNSLEVLNEK